MPHRVTATNSSKRFFHSYLGVLNHCLNHALWRPQQLCCIPSPHWH